MKLIIDIPEEDYKEVKDYGINMFPTVAQAIQNGIPLDDVKAEIDKQEFTHHQGLTHWYMTPSGVKSVVFEILDNIGKAESEDKE